MNSNFGNVMYSQIFCYGNSNVINRFILTQATNDEGDIVFHWQNGRILQNICKYL